MKMQQQKMQLLKSRNSGCPEGRGVRAKSQSGTRLHIQGVDKRSACWSCRQTRRYMVCGQGGSLVRHGWIHRLWWKLLDFRQDSWDNLCLHHPSVCWVEKSLEKSRWGKVNEEGHTDQRVWVPPPLSRLRILVESDRCLWWGCAGITTHQGTSRDWTWMPPGLNFWCRRMFVPVSRGSDPQQASGKEAVGFQYTSHAFVLVGTNWYTYRISQCFLQFSGPCFLTWRCSSHVKMLRPGMFSLVLFFFFCFKKGRISILLLFTSPTWF